MKLNRHVRELSIAVLATIPGIYFRFAGTELTPPMEALIAGAAILGAAFIILWACDVIQLDVSQSLAVALVALIAVLPEYAVDMYFTWMAGQDFPGESEYAHYAIANMTGANRLLIGIGWPTIVCVAWFKFRKNIWLDKEHSTELFFLGLATLYAFILPFKGSLAWYDGLAFIALFIWYITIASKRPCMESDLEGPAEMIGSLPTVPRRITTGAMFVFAAFVIVANAEPFSEGLVATGKTFGIDEFLLVQWLAPLASEAPEFIVAILFASRGKTAMALGTLVSSKVNQWTLLVGMIPAVYGISSQQFALPIPMDTMQMHEILLTAAQSLLAVVLLANFQLSFKEALVLLGLFLGQFFISPWFDTLHDRGQIAITGDQVHMTFSAIYIIIAIVIIIIAPKRLVRLAEGRKINPDIIVGPILNDKPDLPSDKSTGKNPAPPSK